jgi:pimeloyl-ACP methyl ester carboxylesterase
MSITGRAALLATVAAIHMVLEGPSIASAQTRERPSGPLASSKSNPQPPRTVLTFSRVPLSTGVTLRVAEAGDPKGEPVVFLHGTSDSWFSWSLVAARLPGDIRAIMPDQRGQGESEKPECCNAMSDLEADVVALLDARGIARATIVGHSHGSFVAQRVAANSPGRVKQLVLVGSSTSPRSPATLELTGVVQTFTASVPPDFIKEFQLSTINGALPQGFLERAIAESALLPVYAWKALVGEMVADTVPKAPRIAARTLILSGEKDAVFAPAGSTKLQAMIRGSVLRQYPGTGHAIHWEQPDKFVEDLVKFMRSK